MKNFLLSLCFSVLIAVGHWLHVGGHWRWRPRTCHRRRACLDKRLLSASPNGRMQVQLSLDDDGRTEIMNVWWAKRCQWSFIFERAPALPKRGSYFFWFIAQFALVCWTNSEAGKTEKCVFTLHFIVCLKPAWVVRARLGSLIQIIDSIRKRLLISISP